MSWSCDICEKGQDDDHSTCRQVEAIRENNEKIDEINKNLGRIIELLGKMAEELK